MSSAKDLKQFNLRTDLAIELIDKVTPSNIDKNIKVTNITLDHEKSKKLEKKEGTYITIEFKDITDHDNANKVKSVFVKELTKLLELSKIPTNASCLVVGLGNSKSTPDSVGPTSLSKIIITNHLYIYGSLDPGFRRVYGISPGVMGQTGIETLDLIKGIVQKIKPNFVITIDALASSSIERVNTTIQMTDAGISPGSGVGNKRKEISTNTLGIPVIAIGVPTVVDAASIVSDTINYMYKHFAYSIENYDKPSSKLKVGVNYLKKDIDILPKDKKKLFGVIGSLKDSEVKSLIYEILNPTGYNLMVTPKEEDFIIEKISDIIGDGVNKALHSAVK